jgi:hypothetical protein
MSGSPLPYSFSPDDYDDTTISDPIKRWCEGEESHGSLSVIKTRYVRSFVGSC